VESITGYSTAIKGAELALANQYRRRSVELQLVVLDLVLISRGLKTIRFSGPATYDNLVSQFFTSW